MNIKAARALLEDALAVHAVLEAPSAWCQFRDYRIEPLADGRVRHRYCVHGACMKVTRPVSPRSARFLALCRLLAYVIGPSFQHSLVAWNDHRTRIHGHILDLLDGAVLEARRRLEAARARARDADDAPQGDRAIERDEDLAHV